MPDAASSLPASDILQHLGTLVERRPPPEASGLPLVSSGSEALNRLLPDGGFRPGTLVEWLAATPGSGASFLALAAIGRLQRRCEAVVAVVDRQRNFYPPAAAAWGIDLSHVMVVRPQNAADELWAVDQALRSTPLAAVVAWPEQIDSYAFRRWQLAAEESGVLGLLIRPDSARREPTWAHLRLAVSTQTSRDAAWRQRVQLLRCRGSFGRGEVELRIDHQTGEIDEARSGNLASSLAGATLDSQTA